MRAQTVAAPPEDNKANRAIVKLVAALLGVAGRDVAIVVGGSQPRKVVEIQGVKISEVVTRLNGALGG